MNTKASNITLFPFNRHKFPHACSLDRLGIKESVYKYNYVNIICEYTDSGKALKLKRHMVRFSISLLNFSIPTIVCIINNLSFSDEQCSASFNSAGI